MEMFSIQKDREVIWFLCLRVSFGLSSRERRGLRNQSRGLPERGLGTCSLKGKIIVIGQIRSTVKRRREIKYMFWEFIGLLYKALGKGGKYKFWLAFETLSHRGSVLKFPQTLSIKRSAPSSGLVPSFPLRTLPVSPSELMFPTYFIFQSVFTLYSFLGLSVNIVVFFPERFWKVWHWDTG